MVRQIIQPPASASASADGTKRAGAGDQVGKGKGKKKKKKAAGDDDDGGVAGPADVTTEPVVIDADDAAAPATGPNTSWSSEEVASWLRVRKLSAKALAAFEGLDGEELVASTAADFVAVGVPLGKTAAVVRLIHPPGGAGQPISIE